MADLEQYWWKRGRGGNHVQELQLVSAFMLAISTTAFGADAPGVTATEIKIGGVFPFSGPASSIGVVGKGILAYVQSINDRGGINGRKINYIAYDDAYSPPKSVEHVRKLVESDDVAFMYGQLGTPGVSATAKFLMRRGVPDLAVITGSAKFTEVASYPVLTTGLVSYDIEGKIYAKYLEEGSCRTRSTPSSIRTTIWVKITSRRSSPISRMTSTRRSSRQLTKSPDPTVDSQVVNLKSSGADALLVAGTPEVLGTGHPQGGGDRLEADLDREFPVKLGVVDPQASRARQIGWCYRRIDRERSDGSALEQ